MLLKTALAATIAVSAQTAFAETFNLTMGSSHPTVVPWVGVLSEHVVGQTNARLEAMGSEDRVEWTESYGGALFGFQDTLEAVEDGLVDAGWVGAGLWEESKMPLQTITYYAPFVTDDQPTLMAIMNDLNENTPAMAQSWEDRGQVFLGASGVETYHLLTTFPVDSLADLEGRKILAPGPSGNWMSAIGAVPVNGALPTYYNSLQTGVADGVISIITGTYPNKIHEVAPYVTLVGVGAQYTGGLSFNRDSWDGLSEDVQSVLRELGAEYAILHAEQVQGRYDQFLQAMRDDPDVTVSEMSAEDRQQWIRSLPDLAGDWAARHSAGPEVLAAYMAAVRAAGVEPGRNWDQ
ncbi:C4-dicarboxylate TRAP transporter substrate-binding protein [uncultured Tateyamaria sp.]|uniref:C4-dicarboxylate TRAP transporter substrate-binding protein n=1 Tax=uncultured Tateyamaria sp. TaxID=455651 RepID=UPI00261EB71C|nr:C4-dicarboxylate TRAP transporter substrate-binding protein [uncultured Tateyamaria sp.]